MGWVAWVYDFHIVEHFIFISIVLFLALYTTAARATIDINFSQLFVDILEGVTTMTPVWILTSKMMRPCVKVSRGRYSLSSTNFPSNAPIRLTTLHVG